MTDESGNVTERYAYDAYGAPTIFDAAGVERATSTEKNRFMYTGREWDEDLSLYYFRARMYDPYSGRFCSRDPIGYGGGVNFYAYVNGRVLRLVDPLGLDWLDTIANFIDPHDRFEDWLDEWFEQNIPGSLVDPLANAGPGVLVAGTTAGVTVVVVGACLAGPEAIAAEGVDIFVESVTGVPLLVSPADILQDGGKICFRCMAKEELEDIAKCGWRSAPDTMPDKCFMFDLEDARIWADEAGPSIGSTVDVIAGVPIPKDILDGGVLLPNVDGVGDGIKIFEPQLPRLPKPTEIHPVIPRGPRSQ